jgi:hypothetical protein
MQGGKIPIETSSSETTDAVQTFLLFQLVDHKTRRFASHRRLAITLLSRVTGEVNSNGRLALQAGEDFPRICASL